MAKKRAKRWFVKKNDVEIFLYHLAETERERIATFDNLRFLIEKYTKVDHKF